MKMSDTPPRKGMRVVSPEDSIAAGLLLRESAIAKLVELGLTEEEVRSLISIDIST